MCRGLHAYDLRFCVYCDLSHTSHHSDASPVLASEQIKLMIVQGKRIANSLKVQLNRSHLCGLDSGVIWFQPGQKETRRNGLGTPMSAENGRYRDLKSNHRLKTECLGETERIHVEGHTWYIVGAVPQRLPVWWCAGKQPALPPCPACWLLLCRETSSQNQIASFLIVCLQAMSGCKCLW